MCIRVCLVALSPASSRCFGPGVGVRFDVKASREARCLNESTEHERIKVDKFPSLLSASNISLGM